MEKKRVAMFKVMGRSHVTVDRLIRRLKNCSINTLSLVMSTSAVNLISRASSLHGRGAYVEPIVIKRNRV